MELIIDDNTYQFNYDFEFSEKLSTHKKKDKITFSVSLYLYFLVLDQQVNEIKLLQTQSENLKYITELEEVPNSIYIAKSNYYWWCFDGCKLLNKTIKEDKNFYDYKGRDIKKMNITLSISYNDVYGSDKKSVIERNIKLNNLLNIR